MREVIMDVFTAVAVTAVLCLVNEGLKQVQALVNGWLEKARDDAEKQGSEMGLKLIDTAKNLVNSTVYNAVAAMEQTKAKDIREEVKKGLKDRGELEILAQDVLYGIKEQLAPDIIAIMEGYVTDLDKYLQEQIESSLLSVKASSQFLEAGALELVGEAVQHTGGE